MIRVESVFDEGGMGARVEVDDLDPRPTSNVTGGWKHDTDRGVWWCRLKGEEARKILDHNMLNETPFEWEI